MSASQASSARASPSPEQVSRGQERPKADEADRMSFACQRCLQPLVIDPSFGSMDEHTMAELSLPISPAPEVDLEPREGEFDRYVPPCRLPTARRSEGFTLVGESVQKNKSVISQGLQLTAELYDMLSCNGSGNSLAQIDHPLCEECTDTLLETMDQQLKCAEDEAQQYQKYLQALEREEEDATDLKALQEQFEKLRGEEEQLKATLTDLEGEKAAAQSELCKHVKEMKALEKEEKIYWKEYSKHKRELLLSEDEFRTLEMQNKYTQQHMDRLRKTNVFSTTFHIWHAGPFATINGFRLGRLPSAPVEWSEINAAWGQTALLLASLAKIVAPDLFAKYQVVPYGSYSYVKVLADDTVLPLYGSGGFRMIFDTKFDKAMVAFLDCLQQFAAEVQKHGNFSLPYDMEKGKIKDNNSGHWYSIKLQFNSEDSWTKACRYMLTNLRWGLAFVGMKFLRKNDVEDSSESDTVNV